MKKLLTLVCLSLVISAASPQNNPSLERFKFYASRTDVYANGALSGITAHQQGLVKRIPGQRTETICDTLHYPLPGTLTYYFLISPNSGYIAGNNSFGDIGKADYFKITRATKNVTSVIYGFAVAKNTSGSDPDITFALWDTTGSNGSPGVMLGNKTLKLSSIVSDVNNQLFTVVQFNQPINVTGSFYAGVMLPTQTGDTLALFTNTDGDVNPGTAWELWNDQTWHAFNATNSWQINLMEAIFPVYCTETGNISHEPGEDDIFVYPNPTRGWVEIGSPTNNFRPVVVTLYNSSGLQIGLKEQPEGNNHLIRLNLSDYDNGLFFIRLQLDDQIIMKKILLLK
jgi:hypothetical protein